MDQSSTIGALAGALTKAQRVFPNVKKTKTATIPTKSGSKYSYTYADLADVWDAIRAPLTDNGLSVVQSPEMMESGLAIVTTIFHESGEWLSSVLVMPVADRTPQALGSAITYLRRYGLCSMLGIVSDEDNDAQDRQDDRPAQTQQPRNAPVKAPEKAQDTPKADGAIAAAPKRIDALQTLWQEEKRLAKALGIPTPTPAADSATDLNNPAEATVDRVNALGRAAKVRVEEMTAHLEALQAQEQPA